MNERRFRSLCGLAAGALFLAGAPAQATDPAPPAAAPAGPMTVYGTALADGWTSCGTATITLSMELSGSARKPIKAEAGPGQTVCLHHEAIPAGAYRGIHFLIHGGSAGGQKIALMPTVNGQPVADKAKEMTLSANGWMEVKVAFATLGAAGQPIDGFVFRNDGATAAPPFYLTEISLEP